MTDRVYYIDRAMRELWRSYATLGQTSSVSMALALTFPCRLGRVEDERAHRALLDYKYKTSENPRVDNAEDKLARECYGYGRWGAPYWFIGLEEGQAPQENKGHIKRAIAFSELSRDGLCDCLKFHKKIEECRWHEANPKTGRVALQPTWKYLILLLLSFQGQWIDDKERSDLQRDYQCRKWGMEDSEVGETCVIELSGLAANSLKASTGRPEEARKEIESIRRIRIERIQKGIHDHEPQFVIMYGTTAKKYWQEIADVPLQNGIPQKTDHTTFLLAEHPTAFSKKGQKKNRYWIDLGVKLREESCLIVSQLS